MKKLLLILTVMLLTTVVALAQNPSPGIFNYQGVARNSVGNVLVNKLITLRLTIRDGAAAGPLLYQESRNVTTNPFGLFNVQVGSAGGSNVTGTVAGINLGAPTSNKFIQVEIDPNGGTTFINIGTAQIASVPYSLYSSLANDLVLPFNKTQADAGTLFKITNSSTGAGSAALEGLTNSSAANVSAIIGTSTSASPGGFSTGVKGVSNGTGTLGIGVWGSHAGGGFGVFGTALSGYGVYGQTSSGVGVFGTSSTSNAGRFDITNAANNTDALVANTNGGAASWALRATSTGLQGAGIFVYNNPAGAANALRVTNNGSGAAISATTSGTGSAGLFSNTNAANNASPVVITTNSTNAPALSISGPNIWGSAMGITNTTSGQEWRTSVNGTSYIITKVTGPTFTPFQLFSDGQVEFANTAGGNRMRILDNGNVGIGTATPLAKLDVSSGASFLNTSLVGSSNVGTWFSMGNTDPGGRWFNIVNTATANGEGPGKLIFFKGSAANNATGQIMTFDHLTSNVGIGTNNPTQRLHVAGTVRIVDGTQANNFILRSDAVGNATWVDPAIIAPGAFLWTRVGTNLWNTTLGDNIGIGTNAPTQKLHVAGTVRIVDGTQANNFILRSDASGNANWVDPAVIAPGALLWTRVGTNLWNTNLGDNVGIGTNAPSTNLHVAGDFRLVNGSQGPGKALVSDAAGVGTWQTLSGVSGVTGVGVTNYIPKWTSATNLGASILFDDGNNVGLGTTTPGYKLDILHSGSTGIRNKSTSSFSVIDIDASSGDASLRFAKAGVNKWNTRNEPVADDYQWFELGGGGERMRIQRGTGNIGINQPAPAYKLDVNHGGSTGLRVQSSASFSVVDIDAFSGDAAIRFQKNGSTQWNLRNQPGTDNFQLFESGVGERLSIQNTTGNVAIGGSTGAYRLDILHGGSTGILNKSSAGFSVLDIDAFSGDAAIRFANNGVNQWSVRNEPGSDNFQIFDISGGLERMRIDKTTGNIDIAQNLNIVGSIAKGSGTFKIDHPLDPENKYLLHSFVESPDMMNIYNGNIVTDASGKAVVKLPDYFQALNMEFRYQLTVIGSFAQAIISKKVNNNQFEIATNVPNIEVSWQVTGVRKDAYANKNRIVAEVEKAANDKGKYLHPKAFNLPESKGIGYATIEEASSLKDIPVKVANKVKVADNSGSVAPQTEFRKVEVKADEVKGTSIEDVKKPSTQENKPVLNPGSTKTD